VGRPTHAPACSPRRRLRGDLLKALRPASDPVPDVVVRVLDQGDGPDLAEDALRALVAEIRKVPATEVHISRRCPRCASTDHGRRVVTPIAGQAVHVSVSRARRRTTVAVASAGPVGVDIEWLDRNRFRDVASVALHPDEGVDQRRPDAWTDLATRWVRKESVVKATGWGLSWDPSRLDVTSPRDVPFRITVVRDGRPVPLWVSDLHVGTEYAAAVAVVSRTPLRVSLVE
jgi:4'-phosphopantetheinyl transferase